MADIPLPLHSPSRSYGGRVPTDWQRHNKGLPAVSFGADEEVHGLYTNVSILVAVHLGHDQIHQLHYQRVLELFIILLHLDKLNKKWVVGLDHCRRCPSRV